MTQSVPKLTSLAEMMEFIYEVNVANGWFDPPTRPFSEDCILLNEEVVEAHREYRHGNDPGETFYVCNNCHKHARTFGTGLCTNPICKGEHFLEPKGCPVEVVDVIIRALDTLKRAGIEDPDRLLAEKMAYNKTRGYRYGGMKA